MQKNLRIIPRLDIKGPNVVKGIQMEGLRVVGRPELSLLITMQMVQTKLYTWTR